MRSIICVLVFCITVTINSGCSSWNAFIEQRYWDIQDTIADFHLDRELKKQETEAISQAGINTSSTNQMMLRIAR